MGVTCCSSQDEDMARVQIDSIRGSHKDDNVRTNGPMSKRSGVENQRTSARQISTRGGGPGDRARHEAAQSYIDSIFSDFNQEMQFNQEDKGATKQNIRPEISLSQRSVLHEEHANEYVSTLFKDIGLA